MATFFETKEGKVTHQLPFHPNDWMHLLRWKENLHTPQKELPVNEVGLWTTAGLREISTPKRDLPTQLWSEIFC